MRIGITGQSGFIGTHLFNFLINNKTEFEIIPFHNDFLNNQNLLEDWVSKCQTIVHLAALSRHKNPAIVYNTNINLISKLLSALENTNSETHILFASSIQEKLNIEYSRSKRDGRKLFSEWAQKKNLPFTGLIIPNVFGPLAKPKYASVVATFSYQITHHEIPKIDVDADMQLIYINKLIQIIVDCILSRKNNEEFLIPYTYQIKVSEILKKLQYFNDCYLVNGEMPNLISTFDSDLFETFISYIDYKIENVPTKP
jgi:UDP-2-acetamido-2,6-beta-L-arabino-hexul-4-ose reductase